MTTNAVEEKAEGRKRRLFLRLANGNVELWANVIVLAWVVVFVIWQGVGFAITIGTVFAIWAILAVSLNLVVGFTGLLSVGHIAFFGIGAYSVAILTSTADYSILRTQSIPTYEWPFFAALPVGIALAGLTALLVGVVFNRFRDDVFVLVSFGFAIISFNLFLNARAVTRGAFGIHEIARPVIGNRVLDGELEFLAMALACLAIVSLVAWFIVSSSFGRVLTAIREDEQAASVFGYRVTHFKLAVWVLSAMMAAMAGGCSRVGRPSSTRTPSSCWSRSCWCPSSSWAGWRRSGARYWAPWPLCCLKRACASFRSCLTCMWDRRGRWCLG